MVNLAQGMPGIVADILSEYRRPMTVEEVAEEVDALGVKHLQRTTYMVVYKALLERSKKKGDVMRVEPGVWQAVYIVDLPKD